MDIVFSNVEVTGNLKVTQFEETKIQCILQKQRQVVWEVKRPDSSKKQTKKKTQKWNDFFLIKKKKVGPV